MAEKQKRSRAANAVKEESPRHAFDGQQYRRLAEAAGDVLVTVDHTGTITYISPAILHLTGYTSDELGGRAFTELFPPTWESYIHELYDGQRAVVSLRSQASGDVWVELVLLHGDDGSMQGTMRDVTERQRIERHLQESEARYRAVVEDQIDLICRYRPDGVLTFVNEAYCRYFGKNIEDLINHSFLTFIPDEDKPLIESQLAQLNPDHPAVNYERRAIINGETHWQAWTERAIYNTHHQWVEIQAVGRDITSQKLAEAQHQIDVIRHRALFERTNDAVFMTQPDGIILAANQQAANMLGHDIEHIVGQPFSKFMPPADNDKLRKIGESLLRGSTVPVFEGVFRRHDGEEFPAELNIALVQDAKGQPLHIQTIVREISHRRQTEDVLQRALLQVETLYTVSQVLINASTLDDMLQAFSSIALDNDKMSVSLLYVHPGANGKAERLEVVANVTPARTKPVIAIGESFRLSDLHLWQAVAKDGRQMLIVADSEAEAMPGMEVVVENLRSLNIRAGVFIPLFSRNNNWVGVVVLAWAVPHQLSVYQQQLYNVLAPQLATLVENRRLFERANAAVAQLSASEERLRTVLTNAPVVLFALDREGTFTLVEGRSLEVLGMIPEDIAGRPLNVLAQAIPNLESSFKRSLKGDIFVKIVEVGTLSLETRFSPLRTPEGEINGVIGLATDVTERRRAEQQLNERIEQLTALQQVEDEISENLDIEYVLTMALDSAVRLSGSDVGFIGLLENDVMRVAESVGNYPRDAAIDPSIGILGRVIRSQESELITDVHADPDYVEIINKTKAKIVIPLVSHEKTIGLLNLETPKPERFTQETLEFAKLLAARIAVAVDNARLYSMLQDQLRELRGLYGQVKKLEQLKTDMIRIASHDLRNPLATIVGYLELLRWDKDEMTPDHRDYIDSIGRATERMQKITSDILSLERIEETANEDNSETVDLNDVVHKFIPEMQDQARKKTQTLSFDLPTRPVKVSGDSIQLNEAMVNLINNAIKYTPPSGQVDVQLRQESNHVIFEVKDNGYGVPEEQQTRLFEPFYRVKTTETKKIEGTGLGLHLVKNIVDRHNGRMIFHSVYGQGSTFGFTLPAAKE
ncbi:MAG: PAS domain S-box protein [Anaerolineae bacterium]